MGRAATRARNVKEAFRPPEDTYHPVVYPVAVVRDSKHPALAQAFIQLLLDREGQAVLARLGFQPPRASDARLGSGHPRFAPASRTSRE